MLPARYDDDDDDRSKNLFRNYFPWIGSCAKQTKNLKKRLRKYLNRNVQLSVEIFEMKLHLENSDYCFFCYIHNVNGCARGVMVIALGNGHGERSSNPGPS